MNVDQRLLDRLVDGELADVARRELLLSFDRSPDHWRQCACAFLEVQELGAALNHMSSDKSETSPITASPSLAWHEHNHHDTSPSTIRIKSRSGTRSSHISKWAALAACLLVGVCLGRWNVGPLSNTASNPANNLGHVTDGGDTVIQPSTIASEPFDGKLNDTNRDKMLVANETVQRRLPLESILEQHYSAIPNDIEDILDRLGQRVERRQIYLPNQSGALPIEEIEIVPVRWDTY